MSDEMVTALRFLIPYGLGLMCGGWLSYHFGKWVKHREWKQWADARD